MGSSELDEFVERVTERTDIYSVVSRYVSLTRRGGRYWGCCPFHNEKTASFSVSADKGLFYCFGCGVGGNVFKFLSLIENITYFEAIKLQAQRLGIELPAQRLTPEQERRRREEKTLLKINEIAQDFYHECLIKTSRGELGRKYLAGRGITAETIETFKLGCAPDDWEELFKNLIRQNFSAQQIESVGLIAKRKNSSGYYDRFRARIMIPITDIFGRVVGFGGRILGGENESTPKYLNTPETVLFNKRNLLFGLDKSNRAINSAGAAVVVEGYMDAISLFSAGIKNVVATLGTAFTPEHAKLILRYAKKIFFCYDSDDAGQRATIRALPIVQAAGAEVFVIKIPDGKDPDEFVRKHGKESFVELIKDAKTLIDYHMEYVLAKTEYGTAEEKIRALQEIFPVIEKSSNKIIRKEHLKKIAASLSLDELMVFEAWKKFSSKSQSEKKLTIVDQPKKISDDRDQIIRTACEDILRTIWNDTESLYYASSLVPPEVFSEVEQEIINWLKTCADLERRPDKLNATNELSEEANAELARILIGGMKYSDDVKNNIFKDSVRLLREIVLSKKYHALLAEADKYVSNDEAAYVKAVEESLKIKKKIDNLKSNRGF